MSSGIELGSRVGIDDSHDMLCFWCFFLEFSGGATLTEVDNRGQRLGDPT
jgi:hypothetical protein